MRATVDVVHNVVEEPYPAAEQEHPYDDRDPAAVQVEVSDRRYRGRGVYRGWLFVVGLAELIRGGSRMGFPGQIARGTRVAMGASPSCVGLRNPDSLRACAA